MCVLGELLIPLGEDAFVLLDDGLKMALFAFELGFEGSELSPNRPVFLTG